MYRKFLSSKVPSKILIIKTSSLGDIIQSFPVLEILKNKFPYAEIDWVVESSLTSIVAAHPLVSRVISMDLKNLKKSWKAWRWFFRSLRSFREEAYDLVFDLQRNCKSGLITAFTRSPIKVGFGWRTTREWPNILATNVRFDVDKNANIRMQYMGLIQKYLEDKSTSSLKAVRFIISQEQVKKIQEVLSCSKGEIKIMVCPGSKWINKQLRLQTMIEFLEKIQTQTKASFFLMWGEEIERNYCVEIQKQLSQYTIIVDRLSIPTWQNLINEMDLMIAVDSSALHLCATTKTASFSVFGPTMPEIFKPMGHNHFAFRGECPYGKTFEKACPLLRTCSTGACIRELQSEEIYLKFKKWWEEIRP